MMSFLQLPDRKLILHQKEFFVIPIGLTLFEPPAQPGIFAGQKKQRTDRGALLFALFRVAHTAAAVMTVFSLILLISEQRSVSLSISAAVAFSRKSLLFSRMSLALRI